MTIGGSNSGIMFFRTLKDIYNGMSEVDFSQNKHFVLTKCLTKMKEITQKFNIKKYDHDQKIVETLVLSNKKFKIKDLDMDVIVKAIKRLWSLSKVQKSFLSNSNADSDQLKYYFDNIELLAIRGFKSAGIIEQKFSIDHAYDYFELFKVIYVGGQKNERRKWIHCFEHGENSKCELELN